MTINSRNFLFLRSLIFGVVAKIVGSFVAFIGIPIIAQTLPLSDYAVFIRAMAVASASGLLYGAISAISIRNIASVYEGRSSEELNNNLDVVKSVFLLIFGISVLLYTLLIIFFFHDTELISVFLIAIVFSNLTGLFQIGDVYRVATRRDHISSVWQFFGNSFLIGFLILFKNHGVFVISLIYFGVPMITQLVISTQALRQERGILFLTFSKAKVFAHLRSSLPSFFNSAVEYSKIFLSGAAVGAISNNIEYAKYTTLILLCARLVNPLSLITRPLLPAYLDAKKNSDKKWLKGMRISCNIFSIFGLIFVLSISWFLKVEWFSNFLPKDIQVSRLDVLFLMLFIYGHGFNALLSGLFLVGEWKKFYFFANLISVFLSILVGYFLLKIDFQSGMLIAMAIGTFLCSILFLVIINFHIFNE